MIKLLLSGVLIHLLLTVVFVIVDCKLSVLCEGYI